MTRFVVIRADVFNQKEGYGSQDEAVQSAKRAIAKNQLLGPYYVVEAKVVVKTAAPQIVVERVQ